MPKSSWIRNADAALYTVLVLWGVYLLNHLVLSVEFTAYGIYPRHLLGLRGILLSPFLHANLGHLVANTVALFVLLTLSLSLSKRLTTVAISVSILLGGGIVWLLGDSDGNYIGASGVIFGLIGFLLSAGIFRRELRALLYGLIALAAYGGSVLTLLELTPGISWLAHAAGLVSGVAVAWETRKRRG